MSDTFDHWGDAMNSAFEEEYSEQDWYEATVRLVIERFGCRDAPENDLDLLPDLGAEE